MFDPVIFKNLQTQFEDDRQYAYDDATGKPPVTRGKLTIGIGWNLTAHGLPQTIRNMLYDIARDDVVHSLMTVFPWYMKLDPVRQMVVTDMAFNMGFHVFLTFHNTIQHIASHDWTQAKDHMLASKWRHQVGRRAIVLADMMETGNMPDI